MACGIQSKSDLVGHYVGTHRYVIQEVYLIFSRQTSNIDVGAIYRKMGSH